MGFPVGFQKKTTTPSLPPVVEFGDSFVKGGLLFPLGLVMVTGMSLFIGYIIFLLKIGSKS